eukprot:g715.t1
MADEVYVPAHLRPPAGKTIMQRSSSDPKGLLRILYTCSTHNEPDYKTALQALDLAHRWQVDVVVMVLANLLQGMITDENFSEIAEHAVLKDVEGLKTAIQRHAAESPAVKAQLKGGHLPAAVQKLFASTASATPEQLPKRRKRL